MASWRRSRSSWTRRRTSLARIARASPRPTPRPETPSWRLPSVEAGSGTSPNYPRSPRGRCPPRVREGGREPQTCLLKQLRHLPHDARIRDDGVDDHLVRHLSRGGVVTRKGHGCVVAIEDAHLAAGLEHPHDLRQHAARIFEVAEQGVGDDRIELHVAQRKRM